RATDGRALDPLHVLRPRGPALLRLRVGDAAARDRLPGHLPVPPGQPPPVPAQHPPFSDRDRPPALAGLPPHVRRGPHQAPRRSLLARPHLHALPLRDAAVAQPAELLSAPDAGVVPPRRGGLQPLRGADRALVRLRAAAAAPCRGGLPRRLPGPPDPERQPLVPELAHHRGLRLLFRRRPVVPAGPRGPPGPDHAARCAYRSG